MTKRRELMAGNGFCFLGESGRERQTFCPRRKGAASRKRYGDKTEHWCSEPLCMHTNKLLSFVHMRANCDRVADEQDAYRVIPERPDAKASVASSKDAEIAVATAHTDFHRRG